MVQVILSYPPWVQPLGVRKVQTVCQGG